MKTKFHVKYKTPKPETTEHKTPPKQMECWWLNGLAGFVVMVVLLVVTAFNFGLGGAGMTMIFGFLYVVVGVSIAAAVSNDKKDYVNEENIKWAAITAIGIPLVLTIMLAVIGPIWTLVLLVGLIWLIGSGL